MQSNITWYCIQHCSDWARIYTSVCIITPYLTPMGEFGVSVVRIGVKISHITMVLHCQGSLVFSTTRLIALTHWGRVTYMFFSTPTIMRLDNGLASGQCQAIIWTGDGILLIGPKGTNFIEILIEIHTFSFKKMHLKMLSGEWRPFCPSLNVLIFTSFVMKDEWRP